MQLNIRPLTRLCLLGALSLNGVLYSTHTIAADSTPTLQQVAAEVMAAEAVRSVKRLQLSYSHYRTDGLWHDLGDLFADDAVAQFGDKTLNGKQAIHDYFMKQAGRTELGLAQGQLNVYLGFQPIINLNADGVSAKGTWHEVALLGQYQARAEWRGGIYENEYRLDNGVWKLSKLGYYHQYDGSYADYGHKAPPAWNVPYHFDGLHLGQSVPVAALQALAAKPTQAEPAALAARIQRLHDETAVQNLQHSWGYYLDRKLWDDAADLFASSGTLELDQRGVYEGGAQIKQALVAFYGPSSLQNGELFDHIHLGTVVTVAADGLSASARSSQLNQLGRNGEYARWEQGTYENDFVKENGVWKLQAVHYYPRFITDYDLGWAQDAQAVPSVSTALAPAAPPSQTYAIFPAQNYVAFHYSNPVTGKSVQYPAGAVLSNELISVAPAVAKDAKASVVDLEKQAKAAIAVDAVENLNSSYGYYIDESNWNGMADTYSVTAGAKELTGAGVYVGRERIRTALNLRGPTTGRSANFFTIHQLVQPVIHVAEDGLSAKARLRLFQSGGNADGSSGSWIGGIYENTAVFEDGEWKFGVQDLHHMFNASYRNGWARFKPTTATPVATTTVNTNAAAATTTPAATGAAGREVAGGGIAQGLGGARSPAAWIAEFPPDRKIRAKQYVFPTISEPAFHYPNPVSGRAPAELLE